MLKVLRFLKSAESDLLSADTINRCPVVSAPLHVAQLQVELAMLKAKEHMGQPKKHKKEHIASSGQRVRQC